MNDIEVRIRQKLKEVIVEKKAKAVVWHHWIIAQGLGESVPDLHSALEDEWNSSGGWIHAYVIGQEEDGRERPGTNKVHDTYNLRLWAFYGFTKGDTTKNSMDIFSQHVEDIKDALTSASKLQTTAEPNGISEMKKHGEWQISKKGVFYMGDKKVHIAQGTIEVFTQKIVPMAPIV